MAAHVAARRHRSCRRDARAGARRRGDRADVRAGDVDMGASRGDRPSRVRAEHRSVADRRRCRRGARRHADRMVRDELPLCRCEGARMGARAAARDAGLRRRVRVHRYAAVRRPRAGIHSRADGMARTRILVSRHPLARRCHRTVHPDALPVRVPRRTRGVSRASPRSSAWDCRSRARRSWPAWRLR